MGARAELKTKLEAVLPAGSLVVPDLSKLPEPDGSTPIICQLWRTNVSPDESYEGRFTQHFELWICTPNKNPAEVEDELDDVVDDVAVMLSDPAYAWPTGFDRAAHVAGFHGYKLDDLTITSTASS